MLYRYRIHYNTISSFVHLAGKTEEEVITKFHQNFAECKVVRVQQLDTANHFSGYSDKLNDFYYCYYDYEIDTMFYELTTYLLHSPEVHILNIFLNNRPIRFAGINSEGQIEYYYKDTDEIAWRKPILFEKR